MSQLYTPFRYDFVGSFLRPEYLKKARADYETGAMSAEELKKTEERKMSMHIIWNLMMSVPADLNR